MSYDTRIIDPDTERELADLGNMTSNVGGMYRHAMPGPYEGGGRYDGMGEPGTVQAVKVALALALGLDPGPMGCAVGWRRSGLGWELHALDGWLFITDGDAHPGRDPDDRRIEWGRSPIAAEPDAVRALVLAVEHVLEVK